MLRNSINRVDLVNISPNKFIIKFSNKEIEIKGVTDFRHFALSDDCDINFLMDLYYSILAETYKTVLSDAEREFLHSKHHELNTTSFSLRVGGFNHRFKYRSYMEIIDFMYLLILDFLYSRGVVK